jgi:hypothetical protein
MQVQEAVPEPARQGVSMVLDVEITLNRFGFTRVSPNKVQIGPLRISWWNVAGKHGVGVEVNWRTAQRLAAEEG